MYRNRLLLSLSVLVLLCIVQATVAFWSSGVARFHLERSQVANQMLSEFIALGADKQRLKVWLAQFLLTEDSQLQERDRLIAQMERSLTTLDVLLSRDQQLAENGADYIHIRQQLRALAILETNVATLKQSLLERELMERNESETWVILIQTFDQLEGLDLRRLIAEAIDLQRARSESAETAAAEAVATVRLIVIILAVLGSMSAALFAIILLRGLYAPIQRLLTGIDALSRGDFSHRIEEQDDREFRNLARGFNEMAAALAVAKDKEAKHTREIESQVSQRTAQLKHALEQLKQAEMQQKRFFADISHELRTPATAIRGEAEIALRGKARNPEEYQDTLQRILDASAALSKRIDDLLMLIRGEHQLVNFRPVQTPCAELCTALAEQTKDLAALNRRPVTVVLDTLIDDQHHVLIEADKISQVWQILLDNALKYSEPDSPLRFEASRNDDELFLSIQDHGVGIPHEEQAHIFERYYRAENARAMRPDGLGIGLSIAQFILEQHDGYFEITSQEGMGTTFTVVLPLIDADLEEKA
ncbi:sensor histidine kinase [Aliidiomarina sanyensis]|uniref:histidine kinase n=1 Tax=Aliidiomarina sanyensis TaxID=1249555 RepID=A0A432WNR2_9GAMM|nr:HAMP domain-containing sensor histidine kinase [Aliidiomarina sanyensis]RUO35442.1 histidine kinase [Aliidiomarina sanyensis]